MNFAIRNAMVAAGALVRKEVEGKYRLTGVWESARGGWDIVREYR
jgi:hypothetical protein